MNIHEPEIRRPYRMHARAEAAEATRVRILETARKLWWEHYYDEVSLQEVADGAGVSLQTVIRRFGSKDGLLAAVSQHISPGVMAEREAIPPGDIDAVVKHLVPHYEEFGDPMLRLQALEDRIPAVKEALRLPRSWHRQWLARTFAELLPGSGAADYNWKLGMFAAAVDLHTWQVLRREQGLSVEETARAMREMLERLTGR
jgi:AcrR family transcriptional regulator